MSLPEWFDVAQTAYWILGILSGGAFLGCIARVLVLSMHEEESRIEKPDVIPTQQHAGNVSTSRGPVQVNVKVIRYKQFHHRRVKGNA
jgi:hypothetical protein